MKVTMQRLRERKLYNTWHAVEHVRASGLTAVYVSYRPVQTGRGSYPAAWQVIRPGFRTDPDGHWHDDGHKTFTVYGRDQKAPQLAQAIRWASTRYGFDEHAWKLITGSGGDWIPGPIYEALSAVLDRPRAAEEER